MPRTYSQELYGFVITDEFDPGNTLLMQQLYNLGLFMQENEFLLENLYLKVTTYSFCACQS